MLLEMCMLPKEKGPCHDDQDRYYFDTEIGKCAKFLFGGCYGNLNNFESLDECESTCHALIETFMAAKPVAVNMGKNSYRKTFIAKKNLKNLFFA